MDEKQATSNEARDTAKTATANTIANVLSMAFGLIAVPIITRIISTSDVGIADTFFVTRNIVAIIVALGTYGFVYRAMLEFKGERENYLFTISIFCIVSALFFFLLSLPFREGVEELLSLTPFLYLWLLPSIICFSLYSVVSYYCIFTNRYKLTAAMIIAVGPLSQLLSIALALILPDDKYIGRVLGLDITTIVISIAFIIWLVAKGNHKFKISYVTFTLKYSIAIIPHAVSRFLLTNVDLLMISYFIGTAAAGVYSMGYTIGNLGYNALAQVMGSWSTWVYRRLDEGSFASVRNRSVLILFAGLLVSLALMLISPELVRIFLPSQYEEAIYVLMPLAAANFLQFVYLFIYDVCYHNKKTTLIAAASIISAALNFVLNLFLIPSYGFIAAAYTTLVSYLVLVLLNYLIARKLSIREIYNMPIIIGCCLACIAVMVVSIALINYMWLRFALLLVIALGFVLAKGKEFLGLIKLLRK